MVMIADARNVGVRKAEKGTERNPMVYIPLMAERWNVKDVFSGFTGVRKLSGNSRDSFLPPSMKSLPLNFYAQKELLSEKQGNWDLKKILNGWLLIGRLTESSRTATLIETILPRLNVLKNIVSRRV
jgi:hypothetical protein